MSQNVYLYCAAAKLNTVIIGLINWEALHEIMDRREHEKAVCSQVFGESLEK